jgi:tRNA threonylcarbamoyladenosine biosynthesis protein TsaB
MLILTIRTDKPEAELGLFDGETQLGYTKWEAFRELSNTIHIKINELLESQGKKLRELEGIVCFKGPGSFTGLRIGLTVGNAIAYSLEIPIVSIMGDDWIKRGINSLQSGKNEKIAVPEYGGEANITVQKK